MRLTAHIVILGRQLTRRVGLSNVGQTTQILEPGSLYTSARTNEAVANYASRAWRLSVPAAGSMPVRTYSPRRWCVATSASTNSNLIIAGLEDEFARAL